MIALVDADLFAVLWMKLSAQAILLCLARLQIDCGCVLFIERLLLNILQILPYSSGQHRDGGSSGAYHVARF